MNKRSKPQLDVDGLIDAYPDCPRWASRLVDLELHESEQPEESTNDTKPHP